MGLGGLSTNPYLCFPRKYRWLIDIKGVTPNTSTPAFTANLLPPKKGARPSVTFRDMEAQHLSETIFFPGKAEWKPINLTLWDYRTDSNENPVFEWLRTMYKPENAEGNDIWTPSVQGEDEGDRLKRTATVFMLNGGGEILEKWIFQHAYPQSVNFGELDMGNSEVVTVDITLRYDRAFRKTD